MSVSGVSGVSGASGGSVLPAWLAGPARWGRRIGTWFLAYLPDRSKTRRPPVRLRLRAAVPASLVRLTMVLLGLLCAWTVATGAPAWIVVVALLIGMYCLPGTMVAGALVMTLGLLMVFDPTTTAWRTPVLVAAVPLMMQLAAVAGQASLRAWIEIRVLALSLRRYLAVQVFAQLLALVGTMVAGLGYVLPQVMALATVAVLALVVLWLPSLGPSRRDDY